ncbi:MAG: outer membrane factor (OMF) lipoprotein [Candidatus Tokpelaia sp. JSC161]|jgi:NodT family efflux transporter outer membrane factor (OMF) lipoprotein|nr:MAG: outer membrane factor (OMF) lipoprotein [Candidatus Tokpelaia sp. JSC161]
MKHIMIYIGLLTLSGCLLVPEKSLIAEKYSLASESSQLEKLSGWWKQLDDPFLNQLIAQAIQNSTNIADAKARIRETRASMQQVNYTLAPVWNASLSEEHSGGNNLSETPRYNANLTSSWEMDLFGANQRSLEAAKYGLDAEKEDLRATTVALIGDIANSYIEVRRLQAQILLTHTNILAQKNMLHLANKKFSSGAISGLELNNAIGQTATIESKIPGLEAELSATIHRLSVLIGKKPLALNQTIPPLRKIPEPQGPLPKNIPVNILSSRPDIRVAERRYAQSTAQIYQRQAELYPSLIGNLATNAAQTGDISWSFGPTLHIPIFQNKKGQAAIEIALAQRDKSFIAYRSSILKALEEIENALVFLKKDKTFSKKIGESVKAYTQSLKLARNLYKSGKTSLLELLNAEESYSAAKEAYINSRAALTKDYIALMKALGGGWDGTMNINYRD